MADQGHWGFKRPNDQERAARLQQKFGKGNDDSKTSPGGQAFSFISGGSLDPLAARLGWTRKEKPLSTDHPAIVAEFDDHLNFEVVESSRRSDPIWASKDMIDKLVEAKKAEEHALKTEEARKKAENVLASAQSEHYCYLQEEGMRDMKVSFTLANPSLTGLDWLFMLKISEETQVGDGDGVVIGDGEEGEVVRGIYVAEDMVVIEEPETTAEPRATE
ncbi:hypothetical protein TIFTF001_029211 [Ficus carica]|uniref:Uncharacterized protein n=2 Tax=Ficus carica TaxID=3494 RepID=A0AA88J260_FICCA|nr:hypothetical protein TIFTF001_029211 [Ficus carica]